MINLELQMLVCWTITSEFDKNDYVKFTDQGTGFKYLNFPILN